MEANKKHVFKRSTINSKRDIPTKTDTRQHLQQFYLARLAPPTDIYTKPKGKQSGDFPVRAVPLGDRSLESLRRGALNSCRA